MGALRSLIFIQPLLILREMFSMKPFRKQRKASLLISRILEFGVGRNVRGHLVQPLHFTEEETESCRGEVVCQ